jgi:hypothetical protein
MENHTRQTKTNSEFQPIPQKQEFIQFQGTELTKTNDLLKNLKKEYTHKRCTSNRKRSCNPTWSVKTFQWHVWPDMKHVKILKYMSTQETFYNNNGRNKKKMFYTHEIEK